MIQAYLSTILPFQEIRNQPPNHQDSEDVLLTPPSSHFFATCVDGPTPRIIEVPDTSDEIWPGQTVLGRVPNEWQRKIDQNVQDIYCYSWWLNQPIWKIQTSKWLYPPQFEGWKFKKNGKPPPTSRNSFIGVFIKAWEEPAKSVRIPIWRLGLLYKGTQWDWCIH